MAFPRQGAPYIRRPTIGAAAPEKVFPPQATFFVQVFNRHTDPVRIFFDEGDADEAENYLELAASGSAGDYWEGPAELFPQMVGNLRGEKTRGPLFLQSTSGNAPITVIFFSRR